MHRLKLVGIGPGTREYVLPKALEAMEKSDTIIAAKRIIPMLEELLVGKKNILPMKGIQDTIDLIEECLKKEEVALIVSGDPLMYSLLRTLKNDEKASKIPMDIIPGIGSLQMLGAKCGISMEDAKIISVHGRKQKRGSIAMAVSEHRDCFFLCSKEQGPAWLSEIMIEYHLENVTVYAGSDLSYAEEEILAGSPNQMSKKEFPSLCVALIHNDEPRKIERVGLLRDSDFIRGKTPMTKEEVRAIIVQKLGLYPDSIVWDVGAGTGSITIEAARFCPFGEVYAIERSETAVELIEKNKEKFHVPHVKVFAGTAREEMKKLPCPDIVFIGGSGGDLEYIIEYLASLKQEIKVVISAVTVETLAQACNCLEKYDKDYEMTQISIGKSRKLGKYHIMDNHNPVTLLEAVIR
ncbi:MAG: precorrin-6y C5,15-methyltransferase (decarboxylating) subunit CbiE [Lachnospiraceae bacterium]